VAVGAPFKVWYNRYEVHGMSMRVRLEVGRNVGSRSHSHAFQPKDQCIGPSSSHDLSVSLSVVLPVATTVPVCIDGSSIHGYYSIMGMVQGTGRAITVFRNRLVEHALVHAFEFRT
jgi:hypothetical protein